MSPTALRGPGERAGPVLPTCPALCKPQIPGRGHMRTAGTHSLGVTLCPSHCPWGSGCWERTRGQLSSTKIGVTHIWGSFDIPRLNFAVKISFIKYFSFSLNILHFISGSRFLREGTAVLCGHRDPDAVPELCPGDNIVPCTTCGDRLCCGTGRCGDSEVWDLHEHPAACRDHGIMAWFGLVWTLASMGRDIFPPAQVAPAPALGHLRGWGSHSCSACAAVLG